MQDKNNGKGKGNATAEPTAATLAAEQQAAATPAAGPATAQGAIEAAADDDGIDDENAGTANAEHVKVTADGNRFDRIFTGLIFSPSDNGQVYARRDGTKSMKVANVLIEVLDSETYIRGSVYVRQRQGSKVPTVDMTFFGTQQAQAILPNSDKAKAELTAWRKKAGTAYIGWRKVNGGAKPSSANAEVSDESLAGISFE